MEWYHILLLTVGGLSLIVGLILKVIEIKIRNEKKSKSNNG